MGAINSPARKGSVKLRTTGSGEEEKRAKDERERRRKLSVALGGDKEEVIASDLAPPAVEDKIKLSDYAGDAKLAAKVSLSTPPLDWTES